MTLKYKQKWDVTFAKRANLKEQGTYPFFIYVDDSGIITEELVVEMSTKEAEKHKDKSIIMGLKSASEALPVEATQ